MAIKAIFLDIDGTLTNDRKEITPLTLSILLKAQKLGIRLVIASGRPAIGLYQYGDLLEMSQHHGLFVCYNGSRVVDCESGEVLVNRTMSADTCRRILHHLKQFRTRPMLECGDHVLVHDVYDCMIKDGEREFNVFEYETRMNHYLLTEVPDLEAAVDGPQNKILTTGDSDYLREHAEEMSAPFADEVAAMFTANFYYEYTPIGVDKGSALSEAMQLLNIRPEECIAFGDAENDISMLQYAGIGVAMKNAQEAVLQAADVISEKDNNHDGIAHVLMNYIPELKEED